VGEGVNGIGGGIGCKEMEDGVTLFCGGRDETRGGAG